ncbi:MAG: hypothetical protein ACTSRP_26820 [Candidatus Helarchaeota archaeon]
MEKKKNNNGLIIKEKRTIYRVVYAKKMSKPFLTLHEACLYLAKKEVSNMDQFLLDSQGNKDDHNKIMDYVIKGIAAKKMFI